MSDAAAAAPEAAAKDKEKQAPAAAKGGSKKLLIIIAAAVLVLGAAGGGAWFFMHKSAADEEVTADAGEGDARRRQGHEEGKGQVQVQEGQERQGRRAESSRDLRRVRPAVRRQLRREGRVRFLQVSAQVMTRDPETSELVKLHDPMIRNDLLLLLGNQNYDTICTLEGKEKLRKQALEAVTKVVDDDGGKAKNVEAVYFTSFVMQ